MLKPEFIKSLGKKNISENPEATQQRIRAVWQYADRETREEIFELADMTKVSVERAYKTGGVSAKVIVAIGQVLNIDPLYLIGMSDDKGTFDNIKVMKQLNEWGFEVGKNDVLRQKRTKAQPENQEDSGNQADSSDSGSPVNSAPVQAEPVTVVPKKEKQSTALREVPKHDLSFVSTELSKLLNDDMKARLNELTDNDINLLLQSLNVQSTFNEEKRNRLALIKLMLLM